MKKNIFRCLLVTAAVTVFSSCMENVGNRFTLVNMMSTVVSVTPSQVVVQIDATGAYYFADEFLGKELNVGERCLLEQLTVNNDEQPAGATGSQTQPIKMIEVTSRKVNTKDFIQESQEDETLANDSLELFYAPYINIAKISSSSQTFITFSGATLKKADPDFRLVFKGRLENPTEAAKDTLWFEFKATNDKVGEKGVYEAYAQCFNLMNVKSEQIVKVSFAAKKYQSLEANKINSSYCVITAPKTE